MEKLTEISTEKKLEEITKCLFRIKAEISRSEESAAPLLKADELLDAKEQIKVFKAIAEDVVSLVRVKAALDALESANNDMISAGHCAAAKDEKGQACPVVSVTIKTIKGVIEPHHMEWKEGKE
jgi:hypothetical protein